jgi:DNA invertase Pin-like site-specific DNA recombinase
MKYEYFCFECGSTDNIEHHHVVPKVYGGTKTIPLCIKCHSLIHQKDLTKLRELTKIGRAKALARGVKFGRPKSSTESTETFLNKEKNQQIKELLEAGYSFREIARKIPCSTKTVTKVKKLAKIVQPK